MQAAAARKQAGSFAGEQKVPDDIGALPQKLSMECLKPLEERQASKAAAARKQAGSFAGEQRALGIIGAPPQKLSMECLKPLEERQACSAVCASEDSCNLFRCSNGVQSRLLCRYH